MENKICQSCGMPMTKEEEFGTNKNNTLNTDYCVYCFQKGEFTDNCTMEEQIENNLKHLDEFNKDSDKTFNIDEARKEMLKFFPTLKRWQCTCNDECACGYNSNCTCTNSECHCTEK